MKFYLARDAEGRRHLLTVRTEAKALDKTFQELEIGVDKTSLQSALQELLSEADQLNMQLAAQLKVGPDPRSEPAEPILQSTDEHSNRCVKCHLQLTLTEDGAAALAAGVDADAINDWLETVPMWAVNSIANAVNNRRAAEAAATGATSDMKAGGGEIDPDVEQTAVSEA